MNPFDCKRPQATASTIARSSHGPSALALALALALACSALPAMAREPDGILEVERVKLARRGDSGLFAGSALVANPTAAPVVVALVPRAGEGHVVERPEPTEIPAGGLAELRIAGEVFEPGKHAIELDLVATDPDGASLGEEPIELYLLAERAAAGHLEWRRSSYRALFLKGARRIRGIGPSFAATAGDADGRPLADLPSGYVDLDELERGSTGDLAAPPPVVVPALPIGTAKTFTGRWRWIGTDGLVHPGYGWRVITSYLSGNKWVKADERWINLGTGAFSVTAAIPSNNPVRFTFSTANRYFTPIHISAGYTYQWSTPSFTNYGAGIDIGGWYVDLNTGDARGLGELHRDAIDLWNQLYTRTSLSPLRPASLTIKFPNSDGCGNCANPNGTVWISASRAANHRTIYHELGHQLMYEYWDNQLPPDSGGTHDWAKCYTGGLAISEGFAHFVVHWARVDRHDSAPSFPGTWNVESLPSSVCQDDSANELWAAATFWDLHDAPGGDDDALGFPDEDTLRVFLEGGLTNDMSQLRQKYRDDKQDQGWFVLASIDDIFTQNHTFDPPSP